MSSTLRLRDLNEDEAQTLQRLVSSKMSSARLATRAKIVWMASQGETSAEIARQLGVGIRTVRNSLKEFNEVGLTSFASETTTCPGCSTLMPKGARFCRLCGGSLGDNEGSDIPKITKSAPLQMEAMKRGTGNMMEGATSLLASSASAAASVVAASQQPSIGSGTFKCHTCFSSVSRDASSCSVCGTRYSGRVDIPVEANDFNAVSTRNTNELGKRKRPHWVVWPTLFIILALGVGVWLLMRGPREVNSNKTQVFIPPSSRSYFGALKYSDADTGGAFIVAIYPPGSPADNIGLVGGDIVTSYDGQTVKDASDLSRLVSQTPIGNTVQIVYLRDGETRTAKLTTVSRNEIERLEKEYENRPEGKGFIGEGKLIERVPIQGTKMHGVMLKSVRTSFPADKAGLVNGDIVVEFDGAPIRTPAEFMMRIERALPNTTIKIGVMRGTERTDLPITLMRNN